ncbi:hypothetical protein CA54_01320 [Symmachiella macrocystis]|uniref:GAF domain-containing protein n=1 Tax=Symmachiella macrocystis TaxID=2527985 RepID=A0A5C6BJ04_9PLAN|nr:hypothetical protein [Symmachiella macrocystis]TWU11326.1 hypothetical protein CA54_01320 [Symmachiella macrocystis]
MEQSSDLDPILSAFQKDLAAGTPPLDALRAILNATSGRAVGLWQRQGDALLQIGFCTADDMPAETHDAFAAATKRVPLDETGLGIVKAVQTATPALADLDSQTTILETSATWLARFAARRSLAAPTSANGSINGVLAVSTAKDLTPGHAEWDLICRLAAELGDLLPTSD